MDTIYTCMECNFATIDEIQLDDYVAYNHSNPDPNGPNIMPIIFPDIQNQPMQTKQDHQTHKTSSEVTETSKWYTCNDCNYKSRHKNNWYAHRKTHNYPSSSCLSHLLLP